MKLLASVDHDYKNPDGVLLRSRIEGLTSLVRVLDELTDGAEIEWFDHTGETVMAMKERLRGKTKLEAFRSPHDWQAEPSGCRQGRDCAFVPIEHHWPGLPEPGRSLSGQPSTGQLGNWRAACPSRGKLVG